MPQNNQSKSESVFKNFTNLYELSKTLRFELKPVGNTLDNMRHHLRYNKDLQTFLADQEIEDAYQVLKPIFDVIHEEFITDSLESKAAQKIDFVKYMEDYKDKKDLKKNEDNLRNKISITFEDTSEKWKKEKYNKYNWKKGSKIANGSDILSSQSMIDLIADTNNDEKIQKALKVFEGFFTYFGGFIQNRKNYYETKKEASTAVATRIIHENLPKFCDNSIQLECIIRKKKNGITERTERKSEYLNAYKYLKDQGKITQIKDSESGKMIEAYAIEENIFNISSFSSYLSQKGIEKYNRIIGHYNLLINLYNQARESEEKHLTKKEKTFKRLPQFKTLFKQIGCGKKKTLFFTLTDEKKADAEITRNKGNEAFSVEEILSLAKQAGEKYFKGESADDTINTIPDLLFYLKTRENYEGIYWSKKAMNTISSWYFANYHDLKDRLKTAKIFEKAKRGSEEDVKIPEAIELTGLFEVLDATPDWEELFFRKSLTEELKEDSIENKKRGRRREIIMRAKKPSEALLAMIFDDIEEHADNFIKGAAGVLKLDKYKEKESKEIIKAWMDHALAINQMLKYFLVKESKIKGTLLDSIISNTLKELLFEAKINEKTEVDWFKWYDALRNYLTKKPQDEAKDNKLKLNFGNGNLLNGFVDSRTDKSDNGTQYGGYLFRKKHAISGKYEYFLGISKDSKLFRCYLKDNIINEDKGEFERLEYYQAKSTTFFSDKYSANKQKLINYIFEKVKDKISTKRRYLTEKKEIKDLTDIEKRLLKGDTPTKLIDNIQKEKTFIDILQDEKFLHIIKETVEEIKENIKNYENKIINLKEIQKKKYDGYTGLRSLINDLQSVAKEQKEYNYFFIDNKEFKKACDRREKPLYVFQIVNKDLIKEYKKKEEIKEIHKNLHTMYFDCLLSGKQDTFDIGKGEIFYRKQALKEKKIKKGYEQKPWVIESKRFTENKMLLEGSENYSEKKKMYDGKSFFLHLSMMLNYKAKSYSKPEYAISEINKTINKTLLDGSNVYFLGIDRGEKHLAYYSLVDSKGNLLEQNTLNLPFVDKDGNPRSIKAEKKTIDKNTGKEKTEIVECKDYNELLEARAGDRDFARKNWQTIKSIKELKNGYISQVIRKIIDIATNSGKFTFIVLEDLSIGFKRGRQKIDKSVYQKLELALAKKLNFLVNKDAKAGEIGSVTKAIQLTPPLNNFSDLDKKSSLEICFT